MRALVSTSATRFAMLSLLLAACATPRTTLKLEPEQRADFGVLVMAHGGSPEWNAGVMGAVEPIRERYPVEVALGMAEAGAIQDAVARLEEKGVTRIGVVRLFISGESWFERTRQILGLAPGAPSAPPPSMRAIPSAHDGHGAHRPDGVDPTFWMIKTRASFALSVRGLADGEGMGKVLADRARALSRAPSREAVLVIAHGPADDRENARWLQTIDARADAIRAALPFRRVAVETLREDWPAKRRESEQRIRALVQRSNDEGYATIVIPFRVQGFGPYANVLEGLDYVADGRGLVPHAAVSAWIADEAERMKEETSRVRANASSSPSRGGST